MKILYIANMRLPTEMAHGLQMMKMCEALSRHGGDLELIVPWRFGISDLVKKDPFEYYRVEKSFKIKRIFCFDLTPLNRFLGPISFLTQAFSFAFFSSIYLIFKKSDIIYSRDRFSLFFISLIKRNIVLEVHQLHRSLFGFLLKRVKKFIVISQGLRQALIKKGIDEGKILVAHDGIDLEDFEVKKSKEECRKDLGLPSNKKIILYTGHLYKWKGVETLALSSGFLDSSTLIVVVGGIKWYLSDFKKFVKKNNLEKVLILGYKDYSQIPFYLKAADCLVLTGTLNYETSKSFTSPMKMFEYMVSGQPIVACNLPSFREILKEDNAILVESDNPQAMAIGIQKALNDFVLAKNISEQAYKDVQNYTWDNRAKNILEFINF
jgi:glycosyltransferase involved in cell wall biosynthesis